MTPEQEIRARAVGIKVAFNARVMAACIIKGRVVEAKTYDEDLDDLVTYITTGEKPVMDEKKREEAG